jgi:hypothetical protein
VAVDDREGAFKRRINQVTEIYRYDAAQRTWSKVDEKRRSSSGHD